MLRVERLLEISQRGRSKVDFEHRGRVVHPGEGYAVQPAHHPGAVGDAAVLVQLRTTIEILHEVQMKVTAIRRILAQQRHLIESKLRAADQQALLCGGHPTVALDDSPQIRR